MGVDGIVGVRRKVGERGTRVTSDADEGEYREDVCEEEGPEGVEGPAMLYVIVLHSQRAKLCRGMD